MARDKYNDNDLINYYTKIYEELDNQSSQDPFGSYILQRVKGGQKTVTNKIQTEIRNFDMSFLDTIESVYPAITKIMRDPKKSIRYETEVVAVEKAKKVNSDTVRHLSSHTQLIKEITKEGDVIPSKVQTTFAEEELAIYENRFIKSLVRRIEVFLERRYEVMKVSLESFETERLVVNNEFLVSGQKVNVNLDISIKNDLSVNVETTKEQYNRLLYIREMVQSLKGTDFMRALAKARDVLPPIMKTNIIMHNPDFKLCYGLWLYLDKIDGIATNIDVKEKTLKYSTNFDKDINQCMALALTAFIKNRGIEGIYSSRKLPQIKPPKPIMDNELELELNFEADNKKLEDYTMNEILLSQTSKYFESSLQGLQIAGSTYNESIRVVYRQMLDMLDQIYPKAFGVADEELDSKDLYEQLEFARRRMMITKIVRQQKQMNLARMGKEEKRIEKLIGKLEDKIRNHEAKERERLERIRQREEAQRLAEIERAKKIEARHKKIEASAIDRQKELDKIAEIERIASEEKSIERQKMNTRILPLVESKRNLLRELKAKDDKRPSQAEVEAVLPTRRRDEFDDMSLDDIESLMAENDLIEKEEAQQVEEKPKAKKSTSNKNSSSEDKNKKKNRELSRSIQEKSIDELTDEELEALILANNLDEFDDINIDDTVAEEAVVKEEKPKKTSKAKTTATPKEPKKKKADEKVLKEIPETIEDFDNLSDEELEALMAQNDLLDEVDNSNESQTEEVVEDTSNDVVEETQDEEVDDSTNEEESDDTDNIDTNDDSNTTDTNNENVDNNDSTDSLDNLSDEELEALLAQNQIIDDEEEK